MTLLEAEDELNTAIGFVECAFLASHELVDEHSKPLCAVLDAASKKLSEVASALAALRGTSNGPKA